MIIPRKWTLDNLINEANKYSTLKDFRTGSESAYKAYLTQGKPQEVSSLFCGVRTFWTEESATQEAKRYNSRWDFQQKSGGAYRFLWKLDLLDKVFIPAVKHSWCKNSVTIAAKDSVDRTSFKKAFPGAHKFAYNNRMLSELFGDTFNTPKCDNDIVYFWRPEGYKNVYKVGITSKRLGDERINYVANKSGLNIEELFFVVTEDAKLLESKVLEENEAYGFFPKFSGSTEFRVIHNLDKYLMW